MESVEVGNDNNKSSPSLEGSSQGKASQAPKSPVSTGSSSKNGAAVGPATKKAVKKQRESNPRAKFPGSQGPSVNPHRKMPKKKTGFDQTRNPPKDVYVVPEPEARFSVTVNADDRDISRIFASLGVSTKPPKVPRLKNPHAIGAGIRAATMYRQTELPTFVGAKFIVVLDPREAELAFFKDFVTKEQRVCGQRRGVFGHDLASGRPLLNEDPLQSKTCYVANDNAYWYRPDTFFAFHQLDKSPDFLCGGVNVLMSLMDFRGEGECVFLHRYQLSATPAWDEKRVFNETVLNEEDQPIMMPENPVTGKRAAVMTKKVLTIEHPAQPAVDVLEGVGYKRDGVVTWYSAVGAGGTDAHYTHPWEADAFFEHTRYVFVTPGGTRVLMTCHVEGQMGHRTLFSINYSVAPADSSTSDVEFVPRQGYVQNGIIPTLLNELRPKAMSVLRTQDSAVRNFYRDCEGVYSRSMPAAQHLQLGFLGPILYEARMRTYAQALAMQQSFYEPGGVVASVSDVAKSFRQRELEKRMDVGPQISEPIVSLMGETTRLGFLLESLRAVKVWGLAIWQRFTTWIQQVREWSTTGGMPVILDMAKLLQRALRAVPLVERKVHKIRESVLGALWVKKNSESVVALLAKHPLLDNAVHIMAQFIPIFLKATIEECLKRLASPVFLVIAAIEIVADAIDIFYAETYDREEVVNFVRDSTIRIVAHFLLTLIPLPVAVLLHTGVNCVQTWREQRVFSRLREAVLEQSLDDYLNDAELTPLSFREEDYSWVPDSVLVKEGDGMVPVKQRPELLDVARHQEFATKKLVALSCEASLLMARPQGGLLSMCQMVKVRLESPTPKPDRENIRMGYQVAKEYIFKDFRAVEPLSVAEFRVYIRGQEFSAAKEQWYMTRLDLLEKEGEPKVPVQPIVAKQDEVLPLRDDLVEPEKVKERPIYPIEVDQLDLMRWLLVWKRNFSDTFEIRRQGHLFTFTYMLDSRADLLDEWIARWSTEDGFHMLALGDDNIMMFVCHRRGWVGKNARFAAYDLATCDKTCGLDVQLCFIDLMRNGGLSDRQAKAHLARCKGLRELKIRGEPKDRRFYWESKEVSTVTGNPLTSIQAVFCQLCFVCMGWDQWVSGDADDPEELAALIHFAGTANGHLLEWEYDIGDTRRFSNITRRTYLGGWFVPDEEGLKWCPMAWLKTFFLFPDTAKIYGGEHHMEMHAAAISTDQGMLRTPIGSALCHTMRRLASAAGLTKMDFEEAQRKLHQSKSWYQRLKKTPLSLKPVSDGAFFAALQDLCYSRGFDDPIPEWLDLEAELRAISSLPATLGTSGIRCLYQPRFGAPKIVRKGRLDVFAALTNVVRGTRLIIVQVDHIFQIDMSKKQHVNSTAKQEKRRRKERATNLSVEHRKEPGNALNKRPPKEPSGDLARIMKQEFREQYPLGVPGSPGFSPTVFSVNPGDPYIFARLSAIARLFTFWRFTRLRVGFIPEGSAFAADNQKGELCLNFIQDWYSSMPNSMSVARARLPSKVGNAWEQTWLTVPRKLLNTWRFVRDTPGTAGADARLFDVLVALQTLATPNTNVIGYLILDGEVEFRQEYLPSNGNALLQNRIMQWTSMTGQVLTSGTGTSLNMASPAQAPNALGMGFASPTFSPFNLTLFPGTFRLDIHVEVTAGTLLTGLTINVPVAAAALYQSVSTGQRTYAAGTGTTVDAMDLTILYVIGEDKLVGVAIGGPTLFLFGTGTLTCVQQELTLTQVG